MHRNRNLGRLWTLNTLSCTQCLHAVLRQSETAKEMKKLKRQRSAIIIENSRDSHNSDNTLHEIDRLVKEERGKHYVLYIVWVLVKGGSESIANLSLVTWNRCRRTTQAAIRCNGSRFSRCCMKKGVWLDPRQVDVTPNPHPSHPPANTPVFWRH